MKIKLFKILILLLFACAGAQAQVWEPVGSSEGVSAGGAGRLTLLNDYQDNLLLGYYDVAVSKGNVQKYSEGAWSYLGTSAGITSGLATYNSLCADNLGKVYFTNQFPTLQVRKYESGAWTQYDNASATGINFQASAVSSSNVLYVVSGENSGTVKRYVNGGWEQVGTSGFFGGTPFYLDMVIGNDGMVYVSFNNNGYVHVYKNNVDASQTDAWSPVGGQANLALAASTENFNSSLAIGPDSTLYLAYVSGTAGGNKLNVKKYNGNEWIQLGAENFSQYPVQHTSIAVNTDGVVYVAASNWDNTNFLKNYVLAYDDTGNSWSQAGEGFASENQAINNSLAVDSSGNIYLAFVDSGLGKISVKKLNLAVVAVAGIEITTQDGVPAQITTDNGTLQLLANILPAGASPDVIWSIVSGSTFATINENGVVTATASNAVVTIQATSVGNSSIFDTIEVTISNQDSDIVAQSVAVTTVGGGYPDIFALSDTLQLQAIITPAEADQGVVWSVVDGESIVSVNANGQVTGLTEGIATVRATHIDGTLFDEITVSVFANGCAQGDDSMLFGLGYDITAGGYRGADDFVVADGIHFSMKKIRLSILTQLNSQVTSVDLNFLKSQNGHPGLTLFSVENIVPSSQQLIAEYGYGVTQYELVLDLPEGLEFDQGTYYLNPVATTSNNENVYWDVTVYGQNGGDYYMNYNDCNGWIPFAQGGFDAVFELTGNCTPMHIVVTTVSGAEATVAAGETLPLLATVNQTGLGPDVAWSVQSGSQFGNIDANGVLTAIAAGVVVVRATASDDPAVFTDLAVIVTPSGACSQQALSNNQENGYFFGAPNNQHLAVDINVTSGQFTIQSIEPTMVGCATYFTFVFYTNQNGLPGSVISTVNGTITDDITTGLEFDYYFHRYTVVLNTPVILTTGTYWMEMITNADGWESTTIDVQGQPGAFVTSISGGWLLNNDNAEYVYKINGVCGENCTIPSEALPQLSASCSLEYGDVAAPVLTDSCGTAITPSTPADIFPITQQGTTTIVWTYLTSSGVTVTKNQEIVILDNIAPLVLVQDTTVALAEGGLVTITPETLNNQSTDNCAVASVTISPDSFNCDQLGVQSVTVTVTDTHGNSTTGTVSITVTDPENFCNTASTGTIPGIKDFKLYPNPANDVITLEVNQYANVNAISIYSLLGQEILSFHYQGADGNKGTYAVSLQGLQSGTYLVRVNTDGGNINKQLIKL